MNTRPVLLSKGQILIPAGMSIESITGFANKFYLVPNVWGFEWWEEKKYNYLRETKLWRLIN